LVALCCFAKPSSLIVPLLIAEYTQSVREAPQVENRKNRTTEIEESNLEVGRGRDDRLVVEEEDEASKSEAKEHEK